MLHAFPFPSLPFSCSRAGLGRRKPIGVHRAALKGPPRRATWAELYVHGAKKAFLCSAEVGGFIPFAASSVLS